MERVMARIVYRHGQLPGPGRPRARPSSGCPSIQDRLATLRLRPARRSSGASWTPCTICGSRIEHAPLWTSPPSPSGRAASSATGYNEEVDQPAGHHRAAARACSPPLRRAEKEKTGIRNLKVGYNRVFGYYIEVSKSFRSTRCPTTTSASRPWSTASATSPRS